MTRRWPVAVVAALLLLLLLSACQPRLPPAVALQARSQLVRTLTAAAPGLQRTVLARALAAYECAGAARQVGGPLLLLIDYGLPSSRKRMWLLDLDRREVVLHDWVAHGQKSGGDRPRRFSNVQGSHASSLGLYRALGPYVGRHGLSLKLRGLTPGFNDAAERRSIVLHGADYVSPAFLRREGRMGRSWGCPAVRRSVAQPLIRKLRAGTAVFVHYPHADWLRSSPWMNCPSGDGELAQAAGRVGERAP